MNNFKKKLSTLNSQFSTLPGQTLIETVTALAVVIVLVSSLVTMAIASVRSATLSSNKSTAAQLAYQQLEQVRNARDSGYVNWNAFASLFAPGMPCTNSGVCYTDNNACKVGTCVINTNGPTTYTSGNATFTISISGTTQTDGIHVTANVTWTDSLGPHSENLATVFTNWR